MPNFQYSVPGAAAPNFSQPLSPSLSQNSSTKAAGHDGRSSRQEDADPSAWQQYPPPQLFGMSNGVLPYSPFPENSYHSSASALADYLLPHVGKPEYADCLLGFYDGTTSDNAVITSMPAHRLLLARSPRLASELAHASPKKDPNGLQVVSLSLPSKSVTSTIITESINFLYGGIVKIDPLPELATLSSQAAHARLEKAFGSFIIGTELQIPVFSRIEQDTIKLLLRWDTIERALFLISSSRSNAHKKKSSKANGGSTGLSGDGTPTDSLTTCSNKLAQYVNDFLATNIPVDFSFDGTVAELEKSPRLPPSLSNSKPSISNARLSRIQFGDVQAEEAAEDHEISKMLSQILLSLSSFDLSALFSSPLLLGRLGAAKQTDLVLAVVQERERRRLKAIKASKAAPLKKDHLYDNLHLEEQAESTPEHREQGLTLISSPSV